MIEYINMIPAWLAGIGVAYLAIMEFRRSRKADRKQLSRPSGLGYPESQKGDMYR